MVTASLAQKMGARCIDIVGTNMYVYKPEIGE
jgi:hypothetical protein